MIINFYLHFQNLFVSLNLLAKTALELSQCLYLISCSDSNRFKILQGGPNHTTYEHPQGPVWQPFTSSFTRCATSYPNPRYAQIPWVGVHPVWAYDALNP